MLGSDDMLEPQARAALTDILRPPAGFTLSHAVATTFTLDLDTALTIPLSFAARRVTAEDDPIGILDAVRRSADRVDIFAQAGEVSVGVPPSALMAFLEPMVHPVEVRRGIFHPKVWFLEYEREDDLVYRFVCASRNLTADRSWDVVISLDGAPAPTVSERRAARKTNAPLARLLQTLPKLAVAPLPRERVDRIEGLAHRLRTVVWEAPEGLKEPQFHVWGIGKRPSPEFWGIRGLFISPFLSDAGLAELKQGAYRQAFIVSRGRSIDSLASDTLDDKVKQLYVLDEAVEFTDGDEAQEPLSSRLSGLHAKTYVFDRKDGAHIFLGSLNATGAALHQNVEVMVEVVGKVNTFGVEQTLHGMKGLLEEFAYHGGIEESDDEQRDRDLSAQLRRLAGKRFHARVMHSDDYELHVWCEDDVVVPPGVEITWHPITRPGLLIRGLPGPEDTPSVIGGLGLTDITPFLIITARDSRGARSAQSTAVLVELHEDPAERRDAVIAAHLTDRAAFMRLLMLLLELGGTGFPDAGRGGGTWKLLSGADADGSGLFEALMRAVGPDRAGLEDVQRIIEYISRQPDSRSVLPEGFEALWAAIWDAQQAITEGRHG